jgi:RNA polymerase sigma factor for flagellar operon FliA
MTQRDTAGASTTTSTTTSMSSSMRQTSGGNAIDPERQRLVESCQGLVRSIAWKIHQRMLQYVELDELIAYGQVGLVEAAEQYDPSRQVKFVTYAYYRIRGAIFDGLSKMSWFSRREYHAGHYERIAGDLLETCALDAGPDDSLEGDAAWFGHASRTLCVSCLVDDVACDDGGGERGGVAANEGADPSARAAWGELRDDLNSRIEELPSEPRELLRIIYHENQSLQTAAERLGISRSWASRLHARTLSRLADALSNQ